MTLAGRPPSTPRNGLYPDHWFRRTLRLRQPRRRDLADVLAATLVVLVVVACVLLALALVLGLSWVVLTLLLELVRRIGG